MSMTPNYSDGNRSVKCISKVADYSTRNNTKCMRTGERIAELRKAKSWSQTRLAKEADLSQATIGKLEAGLASGSSAMHRIAQALGTTPAYLVGETDDPSEGYVPVPSVETVAESLGLVPVRELDLSLGMGATYLEVPVTETIRHFDRGWLRTYTKANPESLLFTQGVGDSMQPTILDSDLLLIDTAQQQITVSDKFWAIAYANCGAVKRLRPRADGGIEMISDNPLVPNETAYDGEMHVLGRVVAIVRKM